jgi:hypothetical protein
MKVNFDLEVNTCITLTTAIDFYLNIILLCIKHNRIRQQARSLYKPSPKYISYRYFRKFERWDIEL